MVEALIFSIEEFATFDGPGIRTSVFLKGCHLRCEWCHNPEGQHIENEMMVSQDGSSRYIGTTYTAEDLVQELCKNKDILNATDGGVTFSGGEPLMHHDFLYECLCKLKGQLSRAIQTSGYCEQNIFQKILKEVDYVLFDIKLVDNEKHMKYTGVSNKKILTNLEILSNSNVPFVIRTPLIPSVTDTAENISAIADLLIKHKIFYIELLPYNKFAGGKYKGIGRVYQPSFDENAISQAHIEIFEKKGIEAKIM